MLISLLPSFKCISYLSYIVSIGLHDYDLYVIIRDKEVFPYCRSPSSFFCKNLMWYWCYYLTYSAHFLFTLVNLVSSDGHVRPCLDTSCALLYLSICWVNYVYSILISVLTERLPWLPWVLMTQVWANQ